MRSCGGNGDGNDGLLGRIRDPRISVGIRCSSYRPDRFRDVIIMCYIRLYRLLLDLFFECELDEKLNG